MSAALKYRFSDEGGKGAISRLDTSFVLASSFNSQTIRYTIIV